MEDVDFVQKKKSPWNQMEQSGELCLVQKIVYKNQFRGGSSQTLVNLESENDGIYVFLSNIYESGKN